MPKKNLSESDRVWHRASPQRILVIVMETRNGRPHFQIIGDADPSRTPQLLLDCMRQLNATYEVNGKEWTLDEQS